MPVGDRASEDTSERELARQETGPPPGGKPVWYQGAETEARDSPKPGTPTARTTEPGGPLRTTPAPVCGRHAVPMVFERLSTGETYRCWECLDEAYGR
jgi:hypothetical protein